MANFGRGEGTWDVQITIPPCRTGLRGTLVNWSVPNGHSHKSRSGQRGFFGRFFLALGSKLRGCDLVKIRIGDMVSGTEIRTRSIVIQQKTGRPVQFELTEDVRSSLLAWLERRGGSVDDYVFPRRVDCSCDLSTANMRASWMSASPQSVYDAPSMEHARFDLRRWQ